MITPNEAKNNVHAHWKTVKAEAYKNAKSYCEKTASAKIAKASSNGYHLVKIKVPSKFSYQAVRKVLEANNYEVEMDVGGRFTVKW